MEKFLFIFIHLGIPALVLLSLIFNHPRSKTGMIFTALSTISVLVFMYYWGQWPIAFTLYFKYLLPVLVLGSIVKLASNWHSKARWIPKGFLKITRTFITILFGLLATYLAIQVANGGNYGNSEQVSLSFPLKDGKYYVSLGGSNSTINNHFGTSFQAQWYALDFNKLTKMGTIASPMWSDRNESHAIFGENVYCPCDGVVIETKGNVADNKGATMDVSAEDGMGNYISLDCNGVIVSMVHLKQGSLSVKTGDQVWEGMLLAQVGNSGFSQEPHLHFQAAKYQQDSVLMGVPIHFKGRTLVRNDIYKN